MKVAINIGKSQTDAHRGIGVHTSQLVDYLKKSKGIPIELIINNKNLNKYDLVHYIKFTPFKKCIPFFKNTKSVITIHDLIPLIYPEKYPVGLKGNLIYLIQRILIKRFEAIITISETSKKDICRFIGVNPKKVFVTHLAANECFKEIKNQDILENIRKKYDLYGNFVLYVGDVNYNKNILNLCRAVKLAKTKLVMVGKQLIEENVNLNHPENKSFKVFLEKYSTDQNIKRLGFVSDEDLNAIFNIASLYCQPSLYEGFGLPLLQAFAAGCPVVATRINAHTEIAQNGCLYCDAKNYKDMGAKIKMVLEDNTLKKDLIKKAKNVVKNYSWRKTADETLGVYKKVID